MAQVLLSDPSDENVIPVVEELRRHLAPSNATQLDGKENLSGQNDMEGAEEDGKIGFAFFFGLLMYVGSMFLYLCNVGIVTRCDIFSLIPSIGAKSPGNICEKYEVYNYTS